MKHNYEISAVSVEPITLADAKAFLKLDDFTEDDDYISTLISAAREFCEDFTKTLFVRREVVEYFDNTHLLSRSIALSYVADEFTSLEIKSNGVFATVLASTYEADKCAQTSSIVLNNGHYWPSMDIGRNKVKATYQSGFAVTPKKAIIAMQKLISTWYDDRYDGVQKFPSRVKDILHSYIRYA